MSVMGVNRAPWVHRGIDANDPTRDIKPDRTGPGINLKTAKALGIDISAPLLGAPPPVLWTAYVRNLITCATS